MTEFIDGVPAQPPSGGRIVEGVSQLHLEEQEQYEHYVTGEDSVQVHNTV